MTRMKKAFSLSFFYLIPHPVSYDVPFYLFIDNNWKVGQTLLYYCRRAYTFIMDTTSFMAELNLNMCMLLVALIPLPYTSDHSAGFSP